MKKSESKNVYIYDIGEGLELLNICSKDPVSGKLDRVDTFIGNHARQEFVSVGRTEGLSLPGVIFKYSSYVREQEMMIGIYKEIYQDNIGGKVYDSDGNLKYILKR